MAVLSNSDPSFLVLHTLRCIGVVDEDRVTTASRLDAAPHLLDLQSRGLVELDPGPFGGWSLTEEGRIKHREMVDAEVDASGARAHVRRCYDSFLAMNPVLLQVCSEWQMLRVGTATIINDHSDPDYDASVLTRLMRIDDDAQVLCADLAAGISRFGSYGVRLADALRKALAGQTRYVSDDLESYHTVWFQWHEDLLVTLGTERGSEAG